MAAEEMGMGQSIPPIPQFQSHQTPPHDPTPYPGSPAATHSRSRSPSRCHPVHRPQRDHHPQSPPGPPASRSSHCASAEPAAKQGAVNQLQWAPQDGVKWDGMRRAMPREHQGRGLQAVLSSRAAPNCFSPPPPPSPFQIIPCCKSFRQADILWKVRIDSDNISCGKSPLEKGKKNNKLIAFGKC